MEQRLYDSNKQHSIKKAIRFLLDNEFYFAAYSHPDSHEIHFVVSTENQTEKGFFLQDFNGENHFLISADFVCDDNQIDAIFSLLKNYKSNIAKPAFSNQFSEVDFKKYVHHIVEQCSSKQIEKCVAARTLEAQTERSIEDIFIDLLINYPKAFVNISVSPFGIWMGATPEILVKKSGENQYATMSLAGTKRKDENREWTDKEIEEQAIVTRYICDKLLPISSSLNTSETSTHKAGHLLHLKTEISFKSNAKFDSIARLLHPTPAVCGMPLQKASTIINNFENNRSLYAGFIGPAMESDTCMYVNLRCMQISGNKALLYVGAGITENSDPDKEWIETENKAQTLQKFL